MFNVKCSDIIFMLIIRLIFMVMIKGSDPIQKGPNISANNNMVNRHYNI